LPWRIRLRLLTPSNWCGIPPLHHPSIRTRQYFRASSVYNAKEHVNAVARNRITDLFRRQQPDRLSDAVVVADDGRVICVADLLPSSDAGPDAELARRRLVAEIKRALNELPEEQRGIHRARVEGPELQEHGGGNRRERHHAGAQPLRGAAPPHKGGRNVLNKTGSQLRRTRSDGGQS